MSPQIDPEIGLNPNIPSPQAQDASLPPAPLSLDSLVTTPASPEKSGEDPKDKNFGKFEKKPDMKQAWYNLLQINSAVLLTFIFFLIGGVFFTIAKVNVRSDQGSTSHMTLTNGYKELILLMDSSLGFPGIQETRALIAQPTSGNIQTILNSPLPFLFKKEIMTDLVNSSINNLLNKNTELQDITRDITKYGFIHPDIMGLVEKGKDQTPIMVSLHTLETIKFGTSFQIFSMLDTFLQQAAQSLKADKTLIAETMQQYAERGERDIANYLSMCYLNPYEKLPDCDQIDDFAKYFRYENEQAQVDKSLFKKLLTLIDNKLENSTIPSVQIEFNSFSPSNTKLGFRVNINTLAEDEATFLAKGILNPHVYIISTLVSLLKQSLFVIGDGINVDKITIKKQNINIGNVQIPVNTSSMSFDLPLQNSSEREIFDFYDQQ